LVNWFIIGHYDTKSILVCCCFFSLLKDSWHSYVQCVLSVNGAFIYTIAILLCQFEVLHDKISEQWNYSDSAWANYYASSVIILIY